jgi:hypothetical protein
MLSLGLCGPWLGELEDDAGEVLEEERARGGMCGEGGARWFI